MMTFHLPGETCSKHAWKDRGTPWPGDRNRRRDSDERQMCFYGSNTMHSFKIPFSKMTQIMSWRQNMNISPIYIILPVLIFVWVHFWYLKNHIKNSPIICCFISKKNRIKNETKRLWSFTHETHNFSCFQRLLISVIYHRLWRCTV